MHEHISGSSFNASSYDVFYVISGDNDSGYENYSWATNVVAEIRSQSRKSIIFYSIPGPRTEITDMELAQRVFPNIRDEDHWNSRSILFDRTVSSIRSSLNKGEVILVDPSKIFLETGYDQPNYPDGIHIPWHVA